MWNWSLVDEERQDMEEEFEDTKGEIESVYRRRTDNTMANRKSTKGQTTIYKSYTLNLKSSNTNRTKNRGWTQVLQKGMQFLLHWWHQSC